MADNHDETQHIGIPGYVTVFIVLVIGTIGTYLLAKVDFDDLLFHGANTLVALVIAFTKMSCVMLFFMHVRWSPRLIWLSAVAAFFWLAIMFSFTMQDYFTRAAGVFSF